MDVWTAYLDRISEPQHRVITQDVLYWVKSSFPCLHAKIAWNQPMFTDHGTFIIGFSVAKHHLAVAPERAGIQHFSEEITKAGYQHSKELIRFPWNQRVDFVLLEKIIRFNIADKAHCSTFWRKA